MKEPFLQLRIVIPQHLRVGNGPAYLSALDTLQRRGARVYLQEKLLKLSTTLPAIIEGEASRNCLDQFLAGFAHVEHVVVVTQTTPQAARAAA